MLSTVIIGTVLAIIVTAIIIRLYNNKKKGVSSCGGGCSGCSGCTTSAKCCLGGANTAGKNDVHQSMQITHM